jgi:putative DNA-invertase from lambdoid prophage Rac
VRAGLYARVSTHDQQTLLMQLSAMRDYVAKRGWKITLEVQDIGSGASLRPKREELPKAARRRELDRIIVWATRPLGTFSP